MSNQTVYDYREHLNIMRSRLNFIPSYLHTAVFKEIQKDDDNYLKEYVTPLSGEDKETLSQVMQEWAK